MAGRKRAHHQTQGAALVRHCLVEGPTSFASGPKGADGSCEVFRIEDDRREHGQRPNERL